MKLASLKSGRDGKLVVVDRELKEAIAVPQIAETLQAALDDWKNISPKLQEVYSLLNSKKVSGVFAFDASKCAAPLPRAYQWVDGSAYVNHVELVRKARGATMPPEFWTDPLMYQGCSDTFIGPNDAIQLSSEDWGIDFEAEVVVITDDVPMGISETEAGKHIQLIALVNDISLRNLIPAELAKGFGFLQSKPTSSFAPVVVTPDELGQAWQDYKVHLPLLSFLNDKKFGAPNAGVDMTFNFGKLISHAAKTRYLVAGTLVGSGTVSNSDRTVGSSCIAEKRMLETIASGKPTTSFMKFGDRIRIEMKNEKGESIFGAIDQIVEKYQ